METMNWAKQAQGKSNPVFDDGWYTIAVQGWKTGESKSKKSPQVEIEYLIEELGNESYVDYFSLAPSALWRLATFVSACGIDMESLPEMVVGTEDFNRVINLTKGRLVHVRFEKEQFEGTTRSKTREFKIYDKQPPAPKYGDYAVPDFVKRKALKDAGLVK